MEKKTKEQVGKNTSVKKNKATSGGGKDTNNGGLPAKKSTANGKGDTGGTRGTSQ